MELQRIGTRYEVARLKRTHFPMLAPSFSISSFMRFAREPTSFPPKEYALHASSSRSSNTWKLSRSFLWSRRVPLRTSRHSFVDSGLANNLPLQRTRKHNFGQHESPGIEKPPKREIEKSKNTKIQKWKSLEIEKSKSSKV